MTLVVDLFCPEPEGFSYLNAIEADAAGFESYRHKLWGSDALRSRGARFFPQLKDNDLFVYPEDLMAFEQECRAVGDAADAIAADVWGEGASGDAIRRYIERFLAAIVQARGCDAGVCIT